MNGYVMKKSYCSLCLTELTFENDNKFFYCDAYQNRGIKDCQFCEKNNNNDLIFQKCFLGFILLTNNNTCLNISKNKELDKFENSCEQLTLESNNQLFCTKCKEKYTLLKEDSNNFKGKCKKIPALYDYDFNTFSRDYLYDYFYHTIYNPFNRSYIKVYDDEYYFYNHYRNYPCQEAINLGTFEKPIYSCIKCYNGFNYSFLNLDENYFTKVKNERNNVGIYVRRGYYYNYLDDLLRNCNRSYK